VRVFGGRCTTGVGGAFGNALVEGVAPSQAGADNRTALNRANQAADADYYGSGTANSVDIGLSDFAKRMAVIKSAEPIAVLAALPGNPAVRSDAGGSSGSGQELATSPSAAERAKAVFSEPNLARLPTTKIQGAGDARLVEAMSGLQGVRDGNGVWGTGATQEQIESYLQAAAESRGVSLERFRSDYDNFRRLVDLRDLAAPPVKGYEAGPLGGYNELRPGEALVPMLSMRAANGLPNNSKHMGSIDQLRFGKMVGDVLGVDPVFGALLSPTGGIPGAGNQQISSSMMSRGGGPDVIVPHGIAHDAGGYLLNYHKVGPGYQYSPIDSLPIMSRTNPLAGQLGGIEFFWNLKQNGTPRRPEPPAP
jgi:hypothetical protein